MDLNYPNTKVWDKLLVHWRDIAPKIVRYSQKQDEILLAKCKRQSKTKSKSSTKESPIRNENQPPDVHENEQPETTENILRVDINFFGFIGYTR